MDDVATRVLLVEDHPVNQRVIRRMLENLGCEVELAGDGCEGIELAERRSPHLVLMDCSMPGVDGFEATRRIRRLDGSASRVPIVAITAHATIADREQCIAAGMDAWLPKPTTPEDLGGALRQFTQWKPPSERRAQPEILDMATVRRLCALAGSDDPEFFASLVGDFRVEAAAVVAEVRRGVDPRRALHRLKGASTVVGAMRLAAACAEPVDPDHLEEEVGRALAALDRVLERNCQCD